MEIFILEDGVRVGPFTVEKLLSEVRAGDVPPGTLCWREGLAQWVPVEELFAVPAAPPTIAPVIPGPQVIYVDRAVAAPAPRGDGAVMGAWICLGLALALIIFPFPTFYLYVPLLIAAAICALVALCLGRVASAVCVVFCGVVGVPLAWMLFASIFAGAAGMALKHAPREKEPTAAVTNAELETGGTAAPEKRQPTPGLAAAVDEFERETFVDPAVAGRAASARIAREAASRMAWESAEKEKVRQAAALLKFHQQNAAAGSPSAQVSLARRYLTGDGVPRDENLARAWLQKAASQSDPEAQKLLSNLPP